MVNWLLISTLAFTGISSLDSLNQPGCESLSIGVRALSPSQAPDSGMLVLTYGDNVRKSDLVLHLFTNGGDRNRFNLTAVGAISGLKPGKYVLVVVDKASRYCPSKLDIEITR